MARLFRKAVIVAAGRGTRMRPLTLRKPKALLEVGGETLLERSLRLLRSQGIEETAVVVGFEKERVIERLGEGCAALVNPFFARCNNMGSLWFARSFVGPEPFVYLHSDLIFEPDLLALALAEAQESQDAVRLVADFGPVDEEAMQVHADAQGLLLAGGKGLPAAAGAGEWIGLAFVRESRRLFEAVEGLLLEGGHELYDMSAFLRLAKAGERVRCGSTKGLRWKELDFPRDYEAALELFACSGASR